MFAESQKPNGADTIDRYRPLAAVQVSASATTAFKPRSLVPLGRQMTTMRHPSRIQSLEKQEQ